MHAYIIISDYSLVVHCFIQTNPAHPKVGTISHGDVDCRLGERFDCFLESLQFLFKLFFVPFTLLRVGNDWQSFKLLVCLFFGFFEILQGVLSLGLRHKSCARWVS